MIFFMLIVFFVLFTLQIFLQLNAAHMLYFAALFFFSIAKLIIIMLLGLFYYKSVKF